MAVSLTNWAFVFGRFTCNSHRFSVLVNTVVSEM